MKESLRDLALRVEEKAEDLEFLCMQGGRALVRIASPTGGDVQKVSREWLENYETEIDALSEED